MFINNLHKEMNFIVNRSKNILKELVEYHKKNKIFRREDLKNGDIKMIMSYLTELELLDEKIEDINIIVKKEKSTGKFNFDLILYNKVLKIQNKIKKAKKIEYKLYQNLFL